MTKAWGQNHNTKTSKVKSKESAWAKLVNSVEKNPWGRGSNAVTGKLRNTRPITAEEHDMVVN